MKFVLPSLAIFFGSSLANGFLPNGINTDVTIFNSTRESVTGVSIDGCDKEPCQRPASTSVCLSQGALKWSCHLEEIPVAIRFKIRTANGSNTPRTSDYQKTNAGNVPNFSVHVETTSVDIVALRDVVITLSPQEMLENVWDGETVVQLRSLKPAADRWADIKSAQIFEMIFCESQGCKEGQVKSVPCTFAAKGIRALAYTCRIEPFARFANIKFAAKDKVRTSETFAVESRLRVDLTSEAELKVHKD